MPFTPYAEKAVLDWVFGGATPTRPSARWFIYATGSPDTANASDGAWSSAAAGGSFGRITATFAAANSPQGSVTNLGGLTAGSASGAQTANGWNLYDASSGGNRLMYGTLTAVLGCKSTDNPAIGAGLLKITLS